MEMVAEAKTLLVYMVCDKCGEGLMNPSGSDGFALATYPPMYPHKCNNCGHTENYAMRYPFHKLVPIEVMRKPVGKEIN